MAENTTNQTKLPNTCPKCGKRIESETRAGSLTSYFFQDSTCACGKVKKQHPGLRKAEDGEFCQKCGLKIAGPAKPGSITFFLFQDVRCKCPGDASFAPGAMMEKLWKLKQAEAGSTFTQDDYKESIKTDSAPAITPQESKKETQSRRLKAPLIIGLTEGAVIGGAYRIIKLIGRGGMGEVYLSEHLSLKKPCALKVIPPQDVTEIGWLRFQNEAKAAARLDHECIVKVTDLGIHEGCLPFYAMEYVAGKTMALLIQKQGPMPLATAIDIFDQVCSGVDYAHRNGIIHRDIKPANIMLSKGEDGKILVKVLDFGIAKLNQHDRNKQALTAVGELLGSPFYMSPEQCEGGKIDRRSDIYSLGCCFFESLTGQPPFEHDISEAILRAHIQAEVPTLASYVGEGIYPQSLEVIIAKLLRKNPVERYQTITEFRHDLQRIAKGEEVLPVFRSRSNYVSSSSTSGNIAELETSRMFATNLKPHSKSPAKVVSSVPLMATGLILTASMFGLSVLWPQRVKPPESLVKQQQQPHHHIAAAGDPRLKNVEQDSTENHLITPKSFDDDEPFSKLTVVNNIPMRIFHFPTDIDLGIIGVVKHSYSPARGTIAFRASEFISFDPAPAFATYQNYARRFRRGDIEEIQLSSSADKSLFLTAASVPGVHMLQINGTADKIQPETCRNLDKFSDVIELILLDAPIEEVDLAQLPNLRNLRGVCLFGYKAIDRVLLNFHNSAKLQTLSTDALITKKSLAIISSLPNLVLLQFNFRSCLAVDDLAILANLRNLRILRIYNFPVCLKSIEILRTFKKLEQLNLPGKRITPEGLRYLKTQLPGVIIKPN